MPMLLRGFAIAFLVLILDQASKWAVLAALADQAPAARGMVVAPFLNIVLVYNRGVTFGMFNTDGGANAAVFSGLALAIVGVLVWSLRRAKTILAAAAMGMIIGGAIGNLLDRLGRPGVVDFLDFYLGNWHWYVFNVADAGICIGVTILLVDSLLVRPESPK